MSGTEAHSDEGGIIAWFAANPVAANLLMLLLLVLGMYSAATIKRDLMPEVDSRIITITMPYPGAAPGEVEQGIVLKIEEAVKDIDGIKRIESKSVESLATVTIEVDDEYPLPEVMDEVKIAVDGINSFPLDAEKPTIAKFVYSSQAMQLQIHGANVDEFIAKELAEEIKRELLADKDVSKVEIRGARDYEINIEVSESTLRKYGLTLQQVAQAVAAASVDLPGGAIKTRNGDIMLRTKGQAYRQFDFEKVVLLSYEDGTRLTLGDIATIRDGFVEQQGFATFDGTYSIGLAISSIGDQNTIAVTEAVKRYVAEKRKQLPPGIELDYWADGTYYLKGRLNMMLKNLGLGALMVFMILGMFIELRIAFWVMLGLPVCFLGAFILLPLDPFNVSLNMISLFGFILVLGIMVDDAIIIGESVHTRTLRYGHSLDNVIKGAKEVALPATFGVLTTICAFLPTLFISGPFKNFPGSCGYVVVFCLLFSLVESKWILPAHLAHMHRGFSRWFYLPWQQRLQENNNRRLQDFVVRYYQPFIRRAIERRYITLATFIAGLIIVVGLIGGHWVRYILNPDTPNDYVQADIEMARGTAEEQTLQAIQQVGDAIHRVNEEYKVRSGDQQGFIKHIFTYGRDGLKGFFMLELTKAEQRQISSDQIVKLWRSELGEIPGARVLSVSSAQNLTGPEIAFSLISNNETQLRAAASDVADKLASYPGVIDIRNGVGETVEEIHLAIKPGAEALGLSQADLGRQVREAFYGAEAQRVQRGTEEVKVMVRYPEAERRSVANLEAMYIRTSQGDEVPINAVAELEIKPGYAETTRIDYQTAVQVSARTDKSVTDPKTVVSKMQEQVFPLLAQHYPGVEIRLDGASSDDVDVEHELFLGFVLSLFGIYALLAIPLKSYLQPLIIMSVIPFGIIGAVVGHVIMGMAISMMSIFGIIALSGVVVNDSLIMVEFINRARRPGGDIVEAVIAAGTQRFRAILLTSLTTFFGILPMLLESSVQAQFVIPMAVSLAFGILFATVITLILVPCLYVMLRDLGGRATKSAPVPGWQKPAGHGVLKP